MSQPRLFTLHQIKPDNILLTADKKTVKLCDFGVSEMFAAGDDRIKQSAGSPAFMSPEAAICEPFFHRLGHTCYLVNRRRKKRKKQMDNTEQPNPSLLPDSEREGCPCQIGRHLGPWCYFVLHAPREIAIRG